ncbi:ATP/GTP-binding protein [Streptomyces sp. KPB2]|uniref:TniB family NTP-binding protein n=1 Tax=unclassified Streptomyces TaxID=2593676 RepID=UPI000F703318|nr:MULTISPECIES: TniB family NTP-binding protein [unclassified Streptomyces]AZM73523.1 ATP/GTP-binding protein [Streptomyces sp. KPB2]QKW65493.1 TniB family NTP-binding protein [Streptomyces sp. NA03103]
MASVTAFADFDNEDSEEGPFLPISIWQGWKDFVGTLRLEAPPADDPSWNTQDLEDYHSRFVVMTTPSMKKVSLQLRRLLVLNRRQQGTARRGLIVSGPPTTGKTTTLMELGRIFEHTDRRRHPCLKDRLPVAFVSVPPSATPKMLVSEFARFLGIPVHARMNQAQITDAVCHVLAEKATQLVFVDDVHLLNTRTRTGAETADQMKHLGERIAATFVYAGVDVEHSPLLTGPRGAQIAGRFTLLRHTALPYGTDEQRQTWRDLVGDMEVALRLRHHRPGTLERHAEYLHRRTAGVMGSLSHLIRAAALASIEDGSQRITKKLLADVHLDVRAQERQRPGDLSA